VDCRPVFDHYVQLCKSYTPQRVEQITGVPAGQLRETAKLLWTSRPVSFYAWSGVGQHTNATQTARAITLLYALTGNIAGRGGNVQFTKVPTNDVSGLDLVTPQTREKTLGVAERPLGPPKDGWCTSGDLYRAILESRPYPVKALLTFGTNLLVSHAGVTRATEALERLEFHAHADLFVNPTAAYADVLLPVSSPWEREALRIGFEVTQAANGHVQLRPPAVASRGESRDDGWIAFELAQRLGLGHLFWNGNRDEGLREWLAPSGIQLDDLRAQPEGIHIDLQTNYDAYEIEGFDTPSGRIEIWSETFAAHGQDPLPNFVEPAVGPISRPDLLARYPLVLTSAKPHQFCHSQHRNLPRLRKLLRHPRIDIHPDAANARGIENDDWVSVETPSGQIRARAALKGSIDPDVVVAQHGWWQACESLGLPGYPVVGNGSANFNLLIDDQSVDPISGSTAHRSYLCQIRRIAPPSSLQPDRVTGEPSTTSAPSIASR
ncbi:MAG: molybdopterin-containing oxidoreductase family protein, partial [Gammaproteobacteria bacterium]